MGRKKSYDRDALIAKALEIFRDYGYAGASMQILLDGLGINRFSLYAEFGNKQGLFQAVVDRYNREVVERNFGPLTRPDAGLTEINTLLTFFAGGGNGAAMGRGCLLCNTAVEFGSLDPTETGFVQQYFDDISQAFHNALHHAHRNGELKASVNPCAEADFLTAAVLGMFVLIRANAQATLLRNAADTALNHVAELQVDKERKATGD